MTFVSIPTERTTAATDAILALLTAGCVLYLQRFRGIDPWKVDIWSGAFGLLAASAALGAIAHGVSMAARVKAMLRQPLFLLLGLTVAVSCLAAVYDLFGRAGAARVAPAAGVVAVLFFLLSRAVSGGFVLFVVYEAVFLALCLGAYTWLALARHQPGSCWLALGLLVTLAAAWVQTRKRIHVRLVWEFDANGVFHLVQMVGVVLLIAGLRQALTAAGNG